MNDHQETGRLISMRNTIIVIYTLIASAVFAATCIYFINSKNRALQAQSENFTTIAAQQWIRNLDFFCDNIEQTSSIIFETPEFSSFSPKGPALTAEEVEITDRITRFMTSASYMNDYCDFGMAYSTGGTAGVITDGTRDLIGGNIYSKCKDLLNGRDKAWTVLFSGKVSRICFLKRINSDAIFLSSVYTTSLGNISGSMSGFPNLSMYITNENNRIIYCTDNVKEKPGDIIPSELIQKLDGKSNVTIGDSEIALCTFDLDNGWRIYDLVRSANASRFIRMGPEIFIVIVGVSMLLAFIVIGIIIGAAYSSRPKTPKVDSNKYDPELNVLTPYYCEEKISDMIEISLIGGTWAFAIFKIVGYEMITERLGNEFSKQSLVKLSDILKEHFAGDNAVGINEDNELVVFCDYSDYDIFKAHNDIRNSFEQLEKKLENILVGENEDYRLDVAAGVCIYPDHGNTFDQLEFKAASALEKALENGGKGIVFYETSHKAGGAKR
ncbi:MAG: diguanylate cyclase [Ruminococcus sp.]|nr:diguanylate cyclase [Ruminococcus sp.]